MDDLFYFRAQVPNRVVRMRPRIKPRHPDCYRNKKQNKQRKRPRSGFKQSPDDKTPRPARHVLNHQDGKTAKRNPYPEDERYEVRSKKLCCILHQDCAQSTEHKGNDADNKRALANLIHFGRSLINHLDHWWRSPCCPPCCCWFGLRILSR